MVSAGVKKWKARGLSGATLVSVGPRFLTNVSANSLLFAYFGSFHALQGLNMPRLWAIVSYCGMRGSGFGYCIGYADSQALVTASVMLAQGLWSGQTTCGG